MPTAEGKTPGLSPRRSAPESKRLWDGERFTGAVQQWFGVTSKGVDSYQALFPASGFNYQRRAAAMAAFEAELEKK